MKIINYKFLKSLKEKIILKEIWYICKNSFYYIMTFFKRNPDFLIIGAMKSGTTYLFNLLDSHPQLDLPKKKEIHYFDNNFKLGSNWYKFQFPFKSIKNKLTGEASPYYLYHPLAAVRAYKFNKKFKIIVLLRNPTYRAISHYNMFSKMLNLKWNIETLLSINEEFLIQNHMESKLKNHIQENNSLHRNFSFIKRGIYLYQIQRWMEYFPKENVLILKSEDFYDNTSKNLDQICDFLKIEKFKGFNLMTDKYQGNYENKVDENIILSLNNFYKPHNEELEKFLNRKFNWE